jgi:hypothetical protein
MEARKQSFCMSTNMTYIASDFSVIKAYFCPTSVAIGRRMNTIEMLLQRSGGSPLLSLLHLAEVLHRSPEGLRITLCGDNDLSRMLRPHRRKLGRRVYFDLAAVARVIDDART